MHFPFSPLSQMSSIFGAERTNNRNAFLKEKNKSCIDRNIIQKNEKYSVSLVRNTILKSKKYLVLVVRNTIEKGMRNTFVSVVLPIKTGGGGGKLECRPFNQPMYSKPARGECVLKHQKKKTINHTQQEIEISVLYKINSHFSF